MHKRLIFGRYDYAAFLMLFCYSICSVIIPVALVQIGDDLNFPLNDDGLGFGGALQLGRSFMMVSAMLFSGIFSGKLGNKRTIVIALIVMMIGILSSSVSNSYMFLFIALAFAGLGEGVIEGLATPFVHDLHKKDEPGRYVTFSHGFWSVGVFFCVLTAGYLLTIGVSWRIIVAIAGFLSIIPIVLLVLKPSENGQKYSEPRKKTPIKVILMRCKKIISIPKFWLFFSAMIFAGGGEFCLTFWSASYVQTHLNASPFVGGIATGVFAFGMILGRLFSGAKVKDKYLKHLVVFTAFGAMIVGVIFPHIVSLPLLFVALFLLGLGTAPFWPAIQSYANMRMKVNSTMLFILLSCAGIPGCGIFTFLMGVVGDKIGFTNSFYLAPICYFVMAILIIIDWRSSIAKPEKIELKS